MGPPHLQNVTLLIQAYLQIENFTLDKIREITIKHMVHVIFQIITVPFHFATIYHQHLLTFLPFNPHLLQSSHNIYLKMPKYGKIYCAACDACDILQVWGQPR